MITDQQTMHDRTVTAFFDTRQAADKAKMDVEKLGIPASQISVVEGRQGGTSSVQPQHGEGFWGSLKDLFAPEEDKHAYAEGLSRGGYLLSVHISDAHYEQVLDVLDHDGAVDMDGREAEWKKEGWSGYHEATPLVGTSSAASLGTQAPVAAQTATATTAATTEMRGVEAAGEGLLQLAEETLRVGKRDVNHGRVRLRSYVVEKPVKDSVSLHSETVEVSRKPVDRPLAAGENLFQERTISAEQTSQEAVISKEARVYEEVALNKVAADSTQGINDTVRRTEVEVEDGRTTGAGGRFGVASEGLSSQIAEHLPVIGSDGVHVGTVDHLEGPDHIKLTRTDSTDGQHHLIPQAWVARVDDNVHLNKTSAEAMAGMTAV